ncbi:MAG: hypothetical protein WCJ30_03305 [Deltaproteobacteria bacterium]
MQLWDAMWHKTGDIIQGPAGGLIERDWQQSPVGYTIPTGPGMADQYDSLHHLTGHIAQMGAETRFSDQNWQPTAIGTQFMGKSVLMTPFHQTMFTADPLTGTVNGALNSLVGRFR